MWLIQIQTVTQKVPLSTLRAIWIGVGCMPFGEGGCGPCSSCLLILPTRALGCHVASLLGSKGSPSSWVRSCWVPLPTGPASASVLSTHTPAYTLENTHTCTHTRVAHTSTKTHVHTHSHTNICAQCTHRHAYTHPHTLTLGPAPGHQPDTPHLNDLQSF